jgi:DNA-binding XRE family transcriptional regulator
MTPKQIKLGRVKMGLNQTQFAELMGVVRSAVVAWEHGNDIPQKKNMAKLKEILMPHLWKDLTDEEIWTVLQFRGYNKDNIEIAKAIAAKLKEKNT